MWIAVALVISIRFLYFFEYSSRLPFIHHPVVDAQVYDEWAKDLASGHWLGGKVFYRAPFYPYLLGAIYALAGPDTGRVVAVVLQILLGLGGIYLLFRTGSRLLDRPSATLAALLLAFFAPAAFYETKILPTALGLFLQIATLWSLALAWERGRSWDFLRSGFLGGLYAITRPTGLLFLLLVIFFGAVLTSKRRLPAPRRTWVWLAAGALLVIAPVTVRNRIVGDDWVLISSNAGVTFYHGNNEESRSGLMSVPSTLRSNASAMDQEALETRVAEVALGRELKPSERNRYWFNQGLAFWRANPGRALGIAGQKILKALGPHEFPNNYSIALERQRLWTIHLLPLRFTLFIVLGALGVLWLPRTGGARVLLPAAAATGLLACIIFFVTTRYRLEMVPSLSLLAGLGFVEGYRRLRARRLRWVEFLAAALFLIPSFIPPGMGKASQESIMWIQLGGIYRGMGESEDAERAYRRAVEIYPPSSIARAHLALTLADQGRTEEAAEIVRPALSAPNPPAFAFYAAGIVRESSGDLRGAEAALKEVLRRAPAMIRAHRALLRVFLSQGRAEEVRASWGPPAIPPRWPEDRAGDLLEWVLAADAADSLDVAAPTDEEMRVLEKILP